MDDDEDGGHFFSRAQNGISRTSTPNGKRHRKRARMNNGMVHGGKGEDLLQQRTALPIWTGQCVSLLIILYLNSRVPGRETLVKEVGENDTIVVLGETGSGKTTREPFIVDFVKV